MATEGKVPVRESAGHAVRLWIENWRLFLIVAAIAAAVDTGLVAMLGVTSIAAAFAVLLVRAVAYAAVIGAALHGAASVPGRLPKDAWRNFGAMAVVGFFLFIVIMVGMIPGAVVLGSTLQPYTAQLEAAGQDQAAMAQVMMQFAQENPGVVLSLTLVYFAIWMALTSRLYLAGPASIDQGRVLAFDTWKWTKNNMLRIAAARMILLGPAFALSIAVQALATQVLGASLIQGASAPALISYYVSQFGFYAIYVSLEGALAAYLYRGLKPDTTSVPA